MNGRRDAAATPLLTLTPPAPRNTEGRCQLSGPRERRGSLGEGVRRRWRSWNWTPSWNEGRREVPERRKLKGESHSEKEEEKGGKTQRKEKTKWLHR